MNCTPLKRRAEQFFELVPVATAKSQLGAGVEDHGILTMKRWLQFSDAIQVHDRGAMDAYKTGSLEPALKMAHGLAQQVDIGADMDPHIIPCCLHVLDLFQTEEIYFAARLDDEPFDRLASRINIRQQRAELLAGFGLVVPLDLNAGMLQGFAEARTVEGLQQVVESVRFKRTHGIAIIGGHEYHGRQSRAGQRFEDRETIHERHLNIQKHEFRGELADGSNRFPAIARFAN